MASTDRSGATEQVRASAEVTLVVEVDWLSGHPDQVVAQAMQDALGHTGAVVEHVFYWDKPNA